MYSPKYFGQAHTDIKASFSTADSQPYIEQKLNNVSACNKNPLSFRNSVSLSSYTFKISNVEE